MKNIIQKIHHILWGRYENYYNEEAQNTDNIELLKEQRGNLKARIEATKVFATIIPVMTGFTAITFSIIAAMISVFKDVPVEEKAEIFPLLFERLAGSIVLLIILTILFTIMIHKNTVHLSVVEDIIESSAINCNLALKKKYDYLIIGSGLFGAVFAHEAKKAGKRVLVLERRAHNGGNVYCEQKEGINIHKYGAHIFHTSYEDVWDYVNQFVRFNNFVNSPVANYKGHLYNLPFNMNTFRELWDIVTPEQAADIIAQQRTVIKGEPRNLEEQAISLVGTDIYEKLIKDYTEKQWGRACTELPAFIIKRLPVRYTFDNNYFNDRYQGIPEGGYNVLINALLDGIEVRTGVDYLKEREHYKDIAEKIVYTGAIDEYFNYQFGPLEYRGLHFETERLEEENHQGVAVVNYTEREVPYTRIIEHKHFEFGKQPVTYITKEYPADWKIGDEAYYPVNDAKNQALYAKYAELAKAESNVIFGGRLAEYKYYDMDDVIKSALNYANREFEQ